MMSSHQFFKLGFRSIQIIVKLIYRKAMNIRQQYHQHHCQQQMKLI